MLRAFSTFCLVILFNATLFAQQTVNSYKYIIVPKQYEFQKSEDQYQLNSLTKFLFEKEGYTVFFSDDKYPEDLALNSCAGLKAVVKDLSGMLSTKVTINLVDCYNKTIYSSPEGRSKIKDYKKGYHDAVRKAFAAFQEYKNDTTITESVIPLVVSTPIKETVSEPVAVKDEIVETKSEIVPAVEVTKKAAPLAVIAAPVVVTTQETKVSDTVFTIEGTYFIDMWGECVISKKGNDYKVVGGDEDFEFAEIYNTSKPAIYMVKKTGFKQTQLLELDKDGNLKIDSKSGVKIYKRIN